MQNVKCRAVMQCNRQQLSDKLANIQKRALSDRQFYNSDFTFFCFTYIPISVEC